MTEYLASASSAVQGGEKTVRAYKLRLRDKHAATLNKQARAVNVVWNFANETQRKAAQHGRKWLSGHDLWKLVAGATKEGLDLHSHSAMRVCQIYDKSRRQQRKPWLRWRGRRSLGWVPFNTGHVRFDGDCFIFRGVHYRTMHLRDLDEGTPIRAGSFNADARGRWYINVTVEVPVIPAATERPAVGIDLGLKEFCALSTGETVPAPRLYRAAEAKLATAQRARKTRRTRAIHTKVVNRRKDFLHKLSKRLTDEFGTIVVGDVVPSRLARSGMAKSVLDAGWTSFKKMLEYKAITRSGVFLEVSEVNSTQVCSACGAMPPSRPKGIAHLRIRRWTCDDCGAEHDRDVNAARNIARIGRDTLEGGTYA